MTFDNVMVPIDFSESSIEAFEATIAHFQDAKIYLFHAVDTPRVDVLKDEAGEHFQTREQDQAFHKLNELIIAHAGQADRLEAALGVGKPVKAILEAADQYDIDLIVISSHGDTGITRNLFGHTTYQVSRKANCSVWVIKGRSFHNRQEESPRKKAG